MQSLPHALFSIIADGAGIHKDDISLFKISDRIRYYLLNPKTIKGI
jgi:hypothetical protein